MLLRIWLRFLALFFPWLVLMVYEDIGVALIGLVLQATILGWPIATIWAWKAIPKKKPRKKD